MSTARSTGTVVRGAPRDRFRSRLGLEGLVVGWERPFLTCPPVPGSAHAGPGTAYLSPRRASSSPRLRPPPLRNDDDDPAKRAAIHRTQPQGCPGVCRCSTRVASSRDETRSARRCRSHARRMRPARNRRNRDEPRAGEWLRLLLAWDRECACGDTRASWKEERIPDRCGDGVFGCRNYGDVRGRGSGDSPVAVAPRFGGFGRRSDRKGVGRDLGRVR